MFRHGMLRCGTLLGLVKLGLDRLEQSLQLIDMAPDFLELGRRSLTLLPVAVDLAVRA